VCLSRELKEDGGKKLCRCIIKRDSCRRQLNFEDVEISKRNFSARLEVGVGFCRKLGKC
jgi:hypothetical protein